ncbi:conserved hypothetical protein [Ricinus communis]|uniref:Uncharacterized protein n=1 Tax=Ricinus communis TaxID=3988 RepID=B9TAL7_RICCO|nr:conserved hypothetical protein [Ricinus communis]
MSAQGAQSNLRIIWRIPLLAAALISLVFGINAGLLRLGVNTVLPTPALQGFHGPLMACGFLGTLISLERAVAIGFRWAYVGPLTAAIGAVTTIAGGWQTGSFLFVLSALVHVVASAFIYRRQPALFTLTLLLGAGFCPKSSIGGRPFSSSPSPANAWNYPASFPPPQEANPPSSSSLCYCWPACLSRRCSA